MGCKSYFELCACNDWFLVLFYCFNFACRLEPGLTSKGRVIDFVEIQYVILSGMEGILLRLFLKTFVLIFFK
jgi:hypothetical protein